MLRRYGIDLSEHNRNVPYKDLKKDNDFVVLRAGYGLTSKDKMFDRHYTECRKAGFDIGAYFYSYALNVDDAEKEANYFCEVLKGKQLEYPVFIDMEDADGYKRRNGFPSASVLCDICKKFCSVMEKNGYYVGIYASASWFVESSKLRKLSLKNSYCEWVASWGSNDGNISPLYKPYRDFKKGQNNPQLTQFTSNYQFKGSRYDRNFTDIDLPQIIKNNGLNNINRNSFMVGDRVKPKKAIDYNGKKITIYKSHYYIYELMGDRAVLYYKENGKVIIEFAINTNNLQHV